MANFSKVINIFGINELGLTGAGLMNQRKIHGLNFIQMIPT